MYCNVCGNKLNIGEHFCSKCGAQVLNNQQNSNVVNNGFNNVHQNQNFESNTNLTEQNNINSYIPSDNRITRKKKTKWWRIPIITFLIPFAITILRSVLGVFIGLFGDKESQIYLLLKLFIDGFLPMITIICVVLFIPSIIFAIVMSVKHPTGKDKQFNK